MLTHGRRTPQPVLMAKRKGNDQLAIPLVNISVFGLFAEDSVDYMYTLCVVCGSMYKISEVAGVNLGPFNRSGYFDRAGLSKSDVLRLTVEFTNHKTSCGLGSAGNHAIHDTTVSCVVSGVSDVSDKASDAINSCHGGHFSESLAGLYGVALRVETAEAADNAGLVAGFEDDLTFVCTVVHVAGTSLNSTCANLNSSANGNVTLVDTVFRACALLSLFSWPAHDSAYC